MPTEHELFSAVDALLEHVAQDDLPPRAERRRLREAAGLSQAQIAQALDTRREAVGNWERENGNIEPRPPKRAAYARLLEGLAARFPAESPETPAAQESTVQEAFADPPPSAAVDEQAVPAPAPTPVVTPARTHRTRPSSRRPGAERAAAKPPASASVSADPRFENGPLAVVDVEDGAGVRVLHRRSGPGRARQVAPGAGRMDPCRGEARTAEAVRARQGRRPADRAHRSRLRALRPPHRNSATRSASPAACPRATRSSSSWRGRSGS